MRGEDAIPDYPLPLQAPLSLQAVEEGGAPKKLTTWKPTAAFACAAQLKNGWQGSAAKPIAAHARFVASAP